MDDVKIKVIDSDKLINAINEGSYDINLSAVMALGAVMLDTKKQEMDGEPSEQSESCEYYALCRHGRDESKLRARLEFCEYCHEDSDGYVKPIEKNSHAFIHFGMNGWCLELRAKGWHGEAKINYCPMCGRKLQWM